MADYVNKLNTKTNKYHTVIMYGNQFANSCINVGFTRITEPYLRF